MTKQEFYFDGLTNEDLEKLYMQMEAAEDQERKSNTKVAKAAERMMMDCRHQVYEELMRRGEELRGIFLMWKRTVSQADTNDLLDLRRKLDKQRGEGSQIFTDDDYMEGGDPISERADLFDGLMWFLDVGLKEMKGINVR